MRRLLSHLLLLPLALLLVAPLSGVAKPVRTDYVESELVLRHGAAEPGGKVLAGLRLKMDAHWHTYWQNPGDSGMPTTIQWKLPPGFKAGQIQWPAPQKLPIPPLMNYGYEGEIVLPVELSVPKDWPAGQVARIAARADWLVCKDVCLPGGADLEVSLPVVTGNAAPERKWAALFDAALAKLPTQKIAGAKATTADGLIELTLPGIKAANLGGLYVFPIIESLVEPAAAQTVEVVGDGIKFTLMVSKQLAASEPRISGVVVGAGIGSPAAPLSFEAPMSGKLVAGKGIPDGQTAAPGMAPAVAPAADQLSLGLAILFALLGGMILNLMPCVFPVLSLKILSFARGGPAASSGYSVNSNGASATQEAQSRAAMRVQGVAFAVGVIASFVALAAILLGLRAAGEAVGWGFQLQSPLVVTLLALLFFLIGLNLSGVFAFGNLLPGNLAAATLKHPTADALLSGVLAALVASPCTAPFMGAALGFAMTQSTVAALTVFAAMGVGMALPYVLLSFFPAWLKRLPRPGPWLDTFKQAMAFPMYATVVWLAWVLLVQVGADGMVWFGTGLVVIGFGAWLLGRSAGATGRLTALVAILAGVFAANPLPPKVSGASSSALSTATSAAQMPGQATSGWQPYSRTALAELGAKGTPVFVDFTAAWCVTCQVNKKVVLETRAVQEAFAGKKVTLMRADWTRRDPEITAALAAFGRNGVPVYALYAPGKAPVLLPELLTERIVLDALQTF